jgi:hypothetical protein
MSMMVKPQPPLLLRVVDAAVALGVVPADVRKLIDTGELESVVIGDTTLVPAAALSRFVRELRASTPVPA